MSLKNGVYLFIATIEEVMNAFQQLSPEHQGEVTELIHELLEEQEEEKHQPQKRNWREAAGLLLRPGQIPPTDEEAEQIIHDARMKK